MSDFKPTDTKLRVSDEPEGVPFVITPQTLAELSIITSVTRYGMLDILFKVREVGFYEDAEKASEVLTIHAEPVRVLGLTDIIKSKKAVDRDKDRATMHILEALQKKRQKRSRTAQPD